MFRLSLTIADASLHAFQRAYACLHGFQRLEWLLAGLAELHRRRDEDSLKRFLQLAKACLDPAVTANRAASSDRTACEPYDEIYGAYLAEELTIEEMGRRAAIADAIAGGPGHRMPEDATLASHRLALSSLVPGSTILTLRVSLTMSDEMASVALPLYCSLAGRQVPPDSGTERRVPSGPGMSGEEADLLRLVILDRTPVPPGRIRDVGIGPVERTGPTSEISRVRKAQAMPFRIPGSLAMDGTELLELDVLTARGDRT